MLRRRLLLLLRCLALVFWCGPWGAFGFGHLSPPLPLSLCLPPFVLPSRPGPPQRLLRRRGRRQRLEARPGGSSGGEEPDKSEAAAVHARFDLLSTPEAAGLSPGQWERIVKHLRQAGLWWDENDDGGGEACDGQEDGKAAAPPPLPSLMLLAEDFVDRPEVFSSLLMSDFGLPPLVAHQTRALAMAWIRNRRSGGGGGGGEGQTEGGRGGGMDAAGAAPNGGDGPDGSREASPGGTDRPGSDGDEAGPATAVPVHGRREDPSGGSGEEGDNVLRPTKAGTGGGGAGVRYSDREYHATIVNERAKKRKTAAKGDYSYGLPTDYAVRYPRLGSELDDYYKFMTQPSTHSQEDPIRPATAKVYLLHAKLFLGWSINCTGSTNDGNNDDDPNPDRGPTRTGRPATDVAASDVSIFDVIPDKEKDSAGQVIGFVMWLRNRDVSVSYEANVLRGIIKLLKFRFARTSQCDPVGGRATFDDIPVIAEVRKLHRDANRRQRLSPRSSDEQKKWISWPEYLRVIRCCKEEVLALRDRYLALSPSELKYKKGDEGRRYSLEQKRVAEAYQRYLILAIFASIPDRQRTIRELEVGRTLVKDRDTGFWTVKHGPEDYKTGRHYGERPAMQLAEELTPAIDDFLENYRPALLPSTDVLLVQSKTGRPMTSDSIFQRVTRSCFKWTGRSTNPHMLRDIIVTHVRETDASEKELEALALFMGHSITMQRDSYDRRTLTTKIAPAVRLMRSVNKMGE